MAEDQIQTCQECGASIYPEHLKIHSAGLWQGKLMCTHCLAEKKMLADPPKSAESLAIAAEDEDTEPISLLPPERGDGASAALSEAGGGVGGMGASAATTTAPRSIRAFGGAAPLGAAGEAALSFRRPLAKEAALATRCRTFHSKLNDASLSHMDRLINEWIDAHDDVHVKFATSSIGVFEGKHAEPNLIVTLFY